MGPDFIHPGKFGPIGSRECARIYAGHGRSPLAWPSAVKTGTASNFTDDYTVGYTTQYTMAVWAGNNNHSPMHNIDGVTGAAPTWNRAMIYAMQRDNLPKTDFAVPRWHATPYLDFQRHYLHRLVPGGPAPEEQYW